MMKRKVALFLFACGMSASAIAAMDNCSHCYADYRACIASGTPRFLCNEAKWDCLAYYCGIQTP